MISGITIREEQVEQWLTAQKFKGAYLLVSTKPDSIYSKKLAELKLNQKLIVDLYTPIFLEKELTLSAWKPQDWLTRFRNKEMVKKFLKRGNHFLVANRRQRDYWGEESRQLGAPLTENDISVLPTGSGIQYSVFKIQYSTRPRVVLWFGGIYPWMNPESLIEAFSRVSAKLPDWKLRFLGGFHPDTGYKDIYRKVESLAKAKIPDYKLEFIPWQEAKSLSKYFADVAFAVHLVKNTSEDYYAHRVRLLTLFSVGIPVLTSGRDVISDLAVRFGAGERVGMTIDKSMESLVRSIKRLSVMRKSCLQIEQRFLEQETDINIRSNDSNHLTLV